MARGATYILALAVPFFPMAPAQGACRDDALSHGRMASLADDRALVLADGRRLILAGIEPPGIAPSRLDQMIGGDSFTFRELPPADRYGRMPALAFADGADAPLQSAVLAQGQSRLTPFGLARLPEGCRAALRAAETAARLAKLGVWGDPRYAMRHADRAADLLKDRGHMTVAEGRVISVRESGGVIYVNFGRRWSQALTVTVLKRNEKTLTAAGLAPRLLENRRIRVRGWVEERNGPRIEVSVPEQIEMADK